jgi:hypothetical protein
VPARYWVLVPTHGRNSSAALSNAISEQDTRYGRECPISIQRGRRLVLWLGYYGMLCAPGTLKAPGLAGGWDGSAETIVTNCDDEPTGL